ncbi:hypothetical protein AB5I41_15830 [Sphingomonas sp. MMS24-JH45]
MVPARLHLPGQDAGGAGYVAPFALALYLAVYPAIAAGLAWRARRPALDTGWVLVFAASWMLAEWLRSWVFTGYASGPARRRMAGAAWGMAWLGRDVGTYALSGLFILAAGALLLLVVRRRWQLAAAIVALLAVQAVRGGGDVAIPDDA